MKKLTLNRETLRSLSATESLGAVGGAPVTVMPACNNHTKDGAGCIVRYTGGPDTRVPGTCALSDPCGCIFPAW